MAEPTNEMAINLPVVTPAPAGAVAPAEMDAYDVDDAMVVGKPAHMHNPADVSVYAQSITPVSGQYGVPAAGPEGATPPVDAVAVFDIVFSVGVNCGDGTTKTYQVVKRIGIDKCKIACDAECTTPVSIVEAKQDKKIAEAAATAKRFRILAGLE